MAASDKIRVDFVCVHNAGRSQIAAAFAKRERAERGLKNTVEIHSGGTEPADTVHETVVDAMAEKEVDISDQIPTFVADLEKLKESNYLITMGCAITKFNPDQYGVESREWDLTNPDGHNMETVREVRDEIESRVTALFDEIERVVEDKRVESDSASGIVGSIRDALSL
jgi:protein-tyrosine-phosphatase